MGLFLKDKYQKYWSWFKENEEKVYNFETDQENIFNIISQRLSLVDSNLTFEISSIMDNGKREFIISAGGIKSSFPSVEKLALIAPDFEKWTIIKYRPRRNTLSELYFQGQQVKPADVFYTFLRDENPNKLGIILFFKEYQDSEKDVWGQIGYLFLDEALGEYDVETKIGFIMIQSVASEYFFNANEIIDLQRKFDEYFLRV